MSTPDAANAPATFSPFDDGVRALLDAQQLSRADDGSTSALFLCRAALRHLVRATLLDRQQIEPTSSEAEIWQQARLLPLAVQGTDKMGWLAGAEDWFERFVVSPSGDLALSQVPHSQRQALLASLLDLAFALARPLDRARNGAAQRARRRRRLGIFLAVSATLLAVFWLQRALAPRNLALGRSVVVPEPDFGIDPAGVVDGNQLLMGFHTSRHRDPSVTIDLGRVERVSRLEIFNRPDCCQDRAVPLLVQTSQDGQQYSTLKREEQTFYHLTIRLPVPVSARYVRLVRGGLEAFHLSEIEVY